MISGEEMVTGASPEVAGASGQEATPEATPAAVDGVASATPAASPQSDAELAKVREDLNRLKSASQKREYEMAKAFGAQIEAMQQQVMQRERELFEAQTQGMEPEQRKQAQSQWEAQQREAQMKTQMEEMQRQMEELTAAQTNEQRKAQAVQLFAYMNAIDNPEELLSAADDPNALIEHIRKRNLELKQKAERQPDPAPDVTRQRPSGQATGLLHQMKDMKSKELRALIDQVSSGRRNVTLGEL